MIQGFKVSRRRDDSDVAIRLTFMVMVHLQVRLRACVHVITTCTFKPLLLIYKGILTK